MAKKATAKKSAKKAAKKAMKKSPKKAARPAKKAAKKASKKAAPKKAAKKSAKKAVKKTVKKAVKKVVKKATAKKSAAKKAVKKAVKKVTRPVKKAVAKKVAPAKKMATKAKKAVRKPAPKNMIQKVENTIGNVTHAVTDFVKDTVSTVIDKITPDRTSDDAPTYQRSSNDDTDNENSTESRGQDDSDSEEEEEGGSDDDEDRKPFVKHRTHLTAGDKAPWFESKDQYGRLITPDSFPGQALVLYFYPKDDTEGCTAESCSLRDGRFHLRDKNYAIIGVSADDVYSHARFADKYNLPFPLLADTDMRMIRDYDVWGQKMLAGRIYDGIVRTTFIINPDGYIRHVITDVDTQNHAQQILQMKEA